jgi:hypothetical protein
MWAAWCLSLVILVNVYTGTLTAMLSAPSYKFVANSLEDVAKNELVMPYALLNGPAEEYIKVNCRFNLLEDMTVVGIIY